MLKTAKQAFTLIEIAITISIIVIISVVVYANFNEINDSGEIVAVSDKMREQVRVAQNFALNGRMLSADKAPYGWGVYFNRPGGKYITYGDLNGSQNYDFPTKLLIHGTEVVSGTTFFDSSVSSTATTTKTVTKNATPINTSGGGAPSGVGGDHWTFDASDYLSIPNHQDFNTGTSSFAIDFWFKMTSFSGSLQKIAEKSNSFYVGVNLAGTTTTARFGFRTSGSVWYEIGSSSTTTLATNVWHHVAAVRDRQFIKIFVDGKAKDVLQIGTTTEMYYDSGSSLNIGSATFAGSVDEIRFVKDWAPWYQSFTPPTKLYSADEEKYQEVKLPPGPVFDKFYSVNSIGATTSITSTIDVFFSPADYLMRINGASATEDSAIITVNRGGSNKGYPGYTPKSFRIWPSGLISATTTP